MSGFYRREKPGTPVSPVIVPGVRIMPSLLLRDSDSDQFRLEEIVGAVEEVAREEGFVGMEVEFEAESGKS
jgi:hypothetical protein